MLRYGSNGVPSANNTSKRQRLSDNLSISQIMDDDDDDVLMTWSLANILPDEQLESIEDAMGDAMTDEVTVATSDANPTE